MTVVVILSFLYFGLAAGVENVAFGDCVFSIDDAGILTRTGICASTSGTLRLSSKHISSLAPDVFQFMSGMTSLELDSNFIDRLPPGIFSSCTSMEHLSMNKNELLTLPPFAFQGPKLKRLYLYANKLETLSSETFKGLNLLTHLNLGTRFKLFIFISTFLSLPIQGSLVLLIEVDCRR
jgi:hypothetical protein